jgi:hypothetical protein
VSASPRSSESSPPPQPSSPVDVGAVRDAVSGMGPEGIGRTTAVGAVATIVDLATRTALRSMSLLMLLTVIAAVCYAMMISAQMFSRAVRSSRRGIPPMALQWTTPEGSRRGAHAPEKQRPREENSHSPDTRASKRHGNI